MTAWYKSVPRSLYVMDVVLLLTFVIVCAPQSTGIAFHEWISFVFLIPFVVHLLFHWDWIVRMPHRFFGALRGEVKFNVVWDTLLYLLMTFAILSGILASEVALPALGIDWQADAFWTRTHHSYSNLLFPLLGVHLAMHWTWIVNVSRQMVSRDKADIEDSVDAKTV